MKTLPSRNPSFAASTLKYSAPSGACSNSGWLLEVLVQTRNLVEAYQQHESAVHINTNKHDKRVPGSCWLLGRRALNVESNCFIVLSAGTSIVVEPLPGSRSSSHRDSLGIQWPKSAEAAGPGVLGVNCPPPRFPAVFAPFSGFLPPLFLALPPCPLPAPLPALPPPPPPPPWMSSVTVLVSAAEADGVALKLINPCYCYSVVCGRQTGLCIARLCHLARPTRTFHEQCPGTLATSLTT